MRAFFYEKQKVALSRGKILLSYMGLLCVMETRTYWVGPLGKGYHVSAMYVEYRKKYYGYVHGGLYTEANITDLRCSVRRQKVRKNPYAG